MQEGIRAASRMTDSQGGQVWLLDGQRLVRKATFGFPESTRGLLLSPGEGLVGKCFSSTKPVSSEDLCADPKVRYPEIAASENTRSCAAVPLLLLTSTIGVLAMMRPEVRPFDEEDIKVLTRYADDLVRALHHVTYFPQLTPTYIQQIHNSAESLRDLSSKTRLNVRAVDLPPGMQKETMDGIIRAMEDADSPLSRSEIAAISGFTPVTVGFYVSFLEAMDRIQVTLVYGKMGRPTHLYRLVGKNEGDYRRLIFRNTNQK